MGHDQVHDAGRGIGDLGCEVVGLHRLDLSGQRLGKDILADVQPPYPERQRQHDVHQRPRHVPGAIQPEFVRPCLQPLQPRHGLVRIRHHREAQLHAAAAALAQRRTEREAARLLDRGAGLGLPQQRLRIGDGFVLQVAAAYGAGKAFGAHQQRRIGAARGAAPHFQHTNQAHGPAARRAGEIGQPLGQQRGMRHCSTARSTASGVAGADKGTSGARPCSRRAAATASRMAKNAAKLSMKGGSPTALEP